MNLSTLLRLSFLTTLLLQTSILLARDIKVGQVKKDSKTKVGLKNNSELKVQQISKMIQKVEGSIDRERSLYLARAIHLQSKNHNLDPRIIIAIIDTESDFRQEALSTTGDLSIAQINPDVWVKEFKRLGLGGLDIERLKIDEAYAIERMAHILNILKKRFSKNDPHWYALYHSATKKYKRAYNVKVKRKIASIQKSDVKGVKLTKLETVQIKRPL